MAMMTRWDAFHDLRGAQDRMSQMNQMLAEALGQDAAQSGAGATSTPAWAPAVDISERKDAYVVTVELPGVKVDDLEIAFQDGLLTIQGDRHPPQGSPDAEVSRPRAPVWPLPPLDHAAPACDGGRHRGIDRRRRAAGGGTQGGGSQAQAHRGPRRSDPGACHRRPAGQQRHLRAGRRPGLTRPPGNRRHVQDR